MKIYTKTGDNGMTVINGQRVPKYDCSIDAQGEIDELNCWIGAIISEFLTNVVLMNVQYRLMDMGAQLATGKIRLKPEHIVELEEEIDKMEQTLPPLKNFILPISPSTIHIARAVCRRAERVVAAWREKYSSPENFTLVLPYLNRLSDFLFVLARYKAEEAEIKWKGNRS